MWFALHAAAAIAVLFATRRKQILAPIEVDAFLVPNVLYVHEVKMQSLKRMPVLRVLTHKQKQARVSLMLQELLDKGVTIENATLMMQNYEKKNVQWKISHDEFRDMVRNFGNQLSYAMQARLLLLWRKTEFQTLIQKYV